MSLFLQTASGDLDLTRGLAILSDPATETAQRLTNEFRLVQGEWDYDTRQGVPYFEQILGQREANLPLVRALVERIVRQTPGVAAVDSVTSELHPDRTCDIVIQCRAAGGALIAGQVGAPFIVA